MSDNVVLTAVELLDKLRVEQTTILRRHQVRNGTNDLHESARGDEADDAQVATATFFRESENYAARGRLELVQDAIARIDANASQFDACQNPRCKSGGKIEHERLNVLPWAKLCCACAAAQQRH